MPSTVPLLVGFTRPENSTDNTGSDFVVGAWIPDSYQNTAPEPRAGADVRVERFSRESYFVANWTGAPATAGTVASKADELAEALDENKVRGEFFFFFSFSSFSVLFFELRRERAKSICFLFLFSFSPQRPPDAAPSLRRSISLSLSK